VFQLTAAADTALGEQLLERFGPPGAGIDAGPPLSDLTVEGGFRRLPLELLHAVVPSLAPLQGVLKGRVEVTGELAAPEIGVALSLLGGTLGTRSLKTAELALDLRDGVLSGGLEVEPEGGGRLVVSPRATVPLVLDGSRTVEEMFGVPDSLKGRVVGNGVPLDVALAFVPGILEAEGEIVMQGAVRGSLLRPEPNVELSLAPARICYSRTSICYEDIYLRATLSPERLNLTRFDFATMPIVRNPLDAVLRPVDEKRAGGLEGSGSISLDGWSLGEFDLQLEGNKAWLLYTRSVQALIDAKLAVTGPWPALAIRGSIDVGDLKVDLGSEDVQRSVQPMFLPENVHVHREGTRRGPGERDLADQLAREEDAAPSLLEQIDVDVGIDLGVNNRVKLAYGIGEAIARRGDEQFAKTMVRSIDLLGKIEPDIRPRGEVRVRMRDGVPRLQGRVGVQTNSKLKVLTANFLLDNESYVQFGGLIADSALELRAVHTSRFGEIAVVVGGALSNPSIGFESDAFDSQADMLAVLLTGRPLSDHSAAEGNATARAVSGALSGFTTRLLDKVVPLDIFQLDLGEDISSGSVEAGKALGPRVVVITRWTWGGKDDENRVEAEVEVLLTRGLYFKTRVGDRAEGSVDVVYKERF
jgi:autotransporter translocation and assembly factor TamB